MNRLTKRTTNCPLPVLVRDRAFGPAYFLSVEDYTDYRNVLEKLARYEDTGLEPEEAEACKVALMGKSLAEIKEIEGISVERMKELAKAEAEGRLLVLPCKVGDMVYFRRGRDILGDTVERIILDGIDNQVLVGAHKAFMFLDFGKTVFLTREDAEKALEVANE